jgi:hypothetical protein
MAKIATFEELIVWQKGMDLAEGVHGSTRSFQKEDLFTLGQLELCRRLALIETDILRELLSLAKEIGRLLHGLWRSLVVGIVCYSLTLIVSLIGLPWTAAQILMP